MRMPIVLISLVLLQSCLPGCSAPDPIDPLFPLTISDAGTALEGMKQTPRMPRRPIVAAAGLGDRGPLIRAVAGDLRSLTNDDAPIIAVSFENTDTFDECRERLISAVESRWPGDDPHRTIAVDVVAFSMGGLVARHAAAGTEPGGKRLDIVRLFTISTPHRGAQMAEFPTLDARIRDMRPESEFLQALDDAYETNPYPIYPYARRGDLQVGTKNTSPPWRSPWWVLNRVFEAAHRDSARDPRILADIALRLRGEVPFAVDPPLPHGCLAETAPAP